MTFFSTARARGCGGDDGSSPGNGDGDSSAGDGDDAAGDGDGTGGGATSDGDEPDTCADTCPGCCDGETCVETPTDAQCGYGGLECGACESWQACGDDLDDFVTFGLCSPIDESTWTITVESVTLYSQKEGPDDWDLFDGPDPIGLP